MAELNDKLITYGNLSTFYDKLQEQGLGGNAIEDASVLPDASENKSKLIRLSSDDNVYVSELKSRTSTTTNRLPDTQQIDKAYLYDTDNFNYYGALYYKGTYKIVCSDGELDGYGWLSQPNSDDYYEFYLTTDNAENISSDSTAVYYSNEDFEGELDNVNKVITTEFSTSDINISTSLSVKNIIPIPATYNAPEANQIGNAYIMDDSESKSFYTGEYVTIITPSQQVSGYLWERGDGYNRISDTSASNIYCDIQYDFDEGNTISNVADFKVLFFDSNMFIKSGSTYTNNEYSETLEWNTPYDSDIIEAYIPQLNAPDSEQVGNAYLVNDYIGGINCVYTGEEETINVSGNTLTAYKWENSTYNEIITYSSKRANEIYNTDRDSDAVHFYIDEGDGECWEATFENSDLTSISTVKYQRTEVTEEWDWQPLTDNATNDDIDAMFPTPEPEPEPSNPVVKRVLMKTPRTGYELSIKEGLVNFNDETIEYSGGTYYKWVKYEEHWNGDSKPDVMSYEGSWITNGGVGVVILTTTLNPTLPFSEESPEIAYYISTDGEESEYPTITGAVYPKEAIIYKDGSITYEE